MIKLYILIDIKNTTIPTKLNRLFKKRIIDCYYCTNGVKFYDITIKTTKDNKNIVLKSLAE